MLPELTTRYDEEWTKAFWLEMWREVTARCEGVSLDDPKWLRIRDHYLPLFEQAYEERDAVLWAETVRNFNVGCPLPKDYQAKWKIALVPPESSPQPNMGEKQAIEVNTDPVLPF